MTKSDLFEEIRNLLRDAQVNTVSNPWLYSDEELTFQVRSAIRHLTVKGISLSAVMSSVGALSPEPTTEQGLLIALYVVARLLSGDLVHKLLQGELGVSYKSGPDSIDTKGAASEFSKAADKYQMEYESLLTMSLTDTVDAGSSVFGDQTVTTADT